MKALTLHRPWAWAIAGAGKDIENRTWRPPAAIIGQRIAIHAGRKLDRAGAYAIQHALGRRVTVDESVAMLREGIVATAVVDRFALRHDSPWFNGPVGWVLRDVIALPQAIPCKGFQGLWNVPDDVLARFPKAA